MITAVTDKLFLTVPLTEGAQMVLGELQARGVRWVINAAHFDNTGVLAAAGMTYYISPFIDSGRDPGPFVWGNLCRFIERWLREDPEGKLAIHCIGGPRRSASVAYLVLRLQGLDDAEARKLLQVTAPGHEPIYACHAHDFLARREEGG